MLGTIDDAELRAAAQNVFGILGIDGAEHKKSIASNLALYLLRRRMLLKSLVHLESKIRQMIELLIPGPGGNDAVDTMFARLCYAVSGHDDARLIEPQVALPQPPDLPAYFPADLLPGVVLAHSQQQQHQQIYGPTADAAALVAALGSYNSSGAVTARSGSSTGRERRATAGAASNPPPPSVSRCAAALRGNHGSHEWIDKRSTYPYHGVDFAQRCCSEDRHSLHHIGGVGVVGVNSMSNFSMICGFPAAGAAGVGTGSNSRSDGVAAVAAAAAASERPGSSGIMASSGVVAAALGHHADWSVTDEVVMSTATSAARRKERTRTSPANCLSDCQAELEMLIQHTSSAVSSSTRQTHNQQCHNAHNHHHHHHQHHHNHSRQQQQHFQLAQRCEFEDSNAIASDYCSNGGGGYGGVSDLRLLQLHRSFREGCSAGSAGAAARGRQLLLSSPSGRSVSFSPECEDSNAPRMRTVCFDDELPWRRAEESPRSGGAPPGGHLHHHHHHPRHHSNPRNATAAIDDEDDVADDGVGGSEDDDDPLMPECCLGSTGSSHRSLTRTATGFFSLLSSPVVSSSTSSSPSTRGSAIDSECNETAICGMLPPAMRGAAAAAAAGLRSLAAPEGRGGGDGAPTPQQNSEEAHHAGVCKPCAFYYSRRKVCAHGERCGFCHHEDHRTISIKQWKKNQQANKFPRQQQQHHHPTAAAPAAACTAPWPPATLQLRT